MSSKSLKNNEDAGIPDLVEQDFESPAQREQTLKEISAYQSRLQTCIAQSDFSSVADLAGLLHHNWTQHQRVFICGNGGSAGNANHLANDFLYGVNPTGRALDVESLSANSAVMTCLANDTGYGNVFAQQLVSKARKGDVLIVLSGSGNSENIVSALKQANAMHMTTVAVVGFTGGKAKTLSDIAIHFDVNDMQIAEDMQLVVGHMLMRDLFRRLNEHSENQ